MAYTTRRERCPLGAVETWIFDLDNTLYPASCRLFDQVHRRMTEFICDRLSVSPDKAAELRRIYFQEHGTTLRGLMTVNNIDPHEFLAFVHDIDLAGVPPDPALVAALQQLDGRKIVHTNGSVRHAERLLEHLGLSDAFSGIIDIVAAEFDPKPAPAGYRLNRADGRGYRPQPGACRRARHDDSLGAQRARLGIGRRRQRLHPPRRR
jgi:putative hydrolase of the HAD superfamily